LPPAERLFMWLAIVCGGLAAVVAGLAVQKPSVRRRHVLTSLVALIICLAAAILVLRATRIRGIPLTGLFESMLLLTIAFGLACLFHDVVISQVWFGAMMAWGVAALVVLAAVVARPAAQLVPAAKTPWAVAHAASMILGGACVLAAAAAAFLYLLADKQLKQKRLAKIVGRMPTLSRLEHMNVLGLQGAFVLLGFGLVSGFVLASVKAAMLEMNLSDWLTDPKTVLVLVAWVLLGVLLGLRQTGSLKGRAVAYATMVVVFLILFAMAGTRVFCGTQHDFSGTEARSIGTVNRVWT